MNEKYCDCGCGELAPIATYSHARYGWVKGQPKRFVQGHNATQRRDASSGRPQFCPCGCGEEVRVIPLTQGKETIVSEEDYAELSQFKWFAMQDRNHWYVARKVRTEKGDQLVSKMHRMIMNAPVDTEIDHKDGNGLNNYRHNLRVCTKTQNMFNRRKYKNNTSGFKGVYRKGTYDKCWQAIVTANGKSHSLGYFSSSEEAARAYDAGALQYHGEFARLNFSNGA